MKFNQERFNKFFSEFVDILRKEDKKETEKFLKEKEKLTDEELGEILFFIKVLMVIKEVENQQPFLKTLIDGLTNLEYYNVLVETARKSYPNEEELKELAETYRKSKEIENTSNEEVVTIIVCIEKGGNDESINN